MAIVRPTNVHSCRPKTRIRVPQSSEQGFEKTWAVKKKLTTGNNKTLNLCSTTHAVGGQQDQLPLPTANSWHLS
tara:strand:+ start:369 stop:590 length:222 start_codon:yes stop_codon:yes gene_type:complete